MKTIIMGTGPFAVPAFRALAPQHDIPFLVTRPPVTVKRGAPPHNPMREAAAALGIDVRDPENVNDAAFVASLASLGADLFVVCDYGQILSRECLAVARLGGINLHGSLLPRYRGAAPVNWPIYFGETRTGVSVIHMSPKMDAGPILACAETDIGDDETAAELEPRLAELGVQCVHQAIRMLADWDGKQPLGEPQNNALATPARRLRKSDGAIDWNRSAGELRNQLRAFQPWPASYTFWEREAGKPLRLILHRARVDLSPLDPAQALPGQVVLVDRESLVVATGEGLLSIESIQPSGKRIMDVAEFLRGYPIRPGAFLSSNAGS